MSFVAMAALLLAPCGERTRLDAPPQSLFDADAARMAARARVDRGAALGEPISSLVLATEAEARRWRAVSDAEMQARSGYCVPAGYRFRRSARADMDGDGRPDLVEMVEWKGRRALKLSYGVPGKRPRLIAPALGTWSGEGVFQAGPNAVMVNYPESRILFLFEVNGRTRARFVGD